MAAFPDQMSAERLRPINTEPLLGHPKYMKAGAPGGSPACFPSFARETAAPSLAVGCLQVADLNRGAFGFVQLAKDLTTGEQVAIKFIERGDKVTRLLPFE